MKKRLIACLCSAGLFSGAFGEQIIYSEYVWLGEVEASNTTECEYVTPWATNLSSGSVATFTATPPVGYKVGEWLASSSTPRMGRSGLNGTGATTGTYQWEYTQEGFFDVGVRFDPIGYTLSYNGNGSTSGSMANESHSYTDSFNLATCAYTNTGYAFECWTNALDPSALYGDGFVVTNGYPLCATNDRGTVTLFAKWSPKDYELTFDPNGGSCNGSSGRSSFTVTYGSTNHNFQAIDARPGYTFNGWFTEVVGGTKVYDGSGKAVQGLYWSNADTWRYDDNLDVFARWTTNTYTVTFNNYGATSAGTGSKTVTYDTKSDSINIPSWGTGYTFGGYFTEKNGAGTKYWDEIGQFVRDRWDIPNNTELHAYRIAASYSVYYNPNGGEGSIDDESCTYGGTISLPDGAALSRENYDFAGWAMNAEASSVKYAGGAVVNVEDVIQNVQSGGITFYAIWRDIRRTLEFDANGGLQTESITNRTVVSGTPYGTLPEAEWEGGKYEFLGWYTAKGSDGEKVTSESSVPYGDGSITLYAHWNASGFSVAFDGNGATFGEMETQAFEFDAPQALTSNVFEKTGYTFSGWATNNEDAANLKVRFSDGATVSNLVDTAGATATLFAAWNANRYTTVFIGNGGVGSMDATNCIYGEEWTPPANAFRREGRTFAGWGLDPTGAVEFAEHDNISNLTAKALGTARLYAIWNDASASSTNELSIATGCKNLDLVVGTPAYPWEVISGVEDKSGNGKVVQSGNPPKRFNSRMTTSLPEGTGRLTFWYKTVIDNTGFSETERTSFDFTVNNITNLQENGTLEWTLFTYDKTEMEAMPVAWALVHRLAENDDDSYVRERDVVWIDGVTWIPDSDTNKTVAATFRLNDGTPAPDDIWTNITCRADAACGTLPDDPPGYGEYKFGGWWTEAKGGRKVDEDTVVADDVTYYARWIKDGEILINTYTVTFDAGYGIAPSQSITVEENNPIGDKLPADPERTGYTFDGWWPAADVDEPVTAETVVTNDMECSARWKANEYKVIFDANGGTVSPAETNVTYGGVYGALPKPEYEGHSFDGWFTKSEGGDRVSASTAVTAAADHTLYAHWVEVVPEITYTVTFDVEDGTSSPISITVEEGMPIGDKLPAGPTRTGYAFAGWWEVTDSGERKITADTVVTTNIDCVVRWAANGYTTVFIGNGGTGSMDPVNCTYGQEWTLPSNAFERAGCDFAGWSLDPAGPVDFADAATVSNLTETASRTVHLYAIWSGSAPVQSTSALSIAVGCANLDITSGGDYPWTVLSNVTDRSGNSQVAKSCNPPERKVSQMLAVLPEGTGQLTFWYKTVICNDGVSELNRTSFEFLVDSLSNIQVYDTSSDWVQCVYDKTDEGAVNVTWALVHRRPKNDDGDYVGENDEVLIDSVTWTPDSASARTVAVTFRLNDGTPAPDDVWTNITCEAGTGIGTLPADPERTGYTFDGWWTAADGGEPVTADTSLSSDLVCYAHWTKNSAPVPETCTVTFRLNDGTPAPDDVWTNITCEAGTGIGTLPADPERTGYTFDGWWTAADGGEPLTTETVVTNDMECLAHWTANAMLQVSVPSIADLEYTGDLQTALVPADDRYVVSQNEGGTTVGVYQVVLSLADTNSYCWAGGDSNPTSLTFTITRAANGWTSAPSMAGWTSGEKPSDPDTGTVKFGEVDVSYRVSGESDTVADRPVAPGDYVAVFTVEGTANYSGLTNEVPFTIATPGETPKSEVEVPVIADVEYTGGLQTADVPASGQYTVVANAGGTNAGVYQVVLSLADADACCWAGGDSNPTSLTFTITRAVNGWTAAPSMAGWTSGEKPNDPDIGTVKFGEVDVSYRVSGESATAADRPVAPGDYVAVFTVEGTANYSGLTNEVPFTIATPGETPKSEVEVPVIADVEYTGGLQTADVPASEQYTVVANAGGTDAGNYPVVLKLADTNSYCWAGGDSSPTSLTFTITRKDIAGAEIVLGPPLQYTGAEQTQTVHSVTIGELAVTTYTVRDNVATEVGTYTLAVEGSGNFTGSATATWTISSSSEPIDSDLSTWPDDGPYNPLVANVYDGFILDKDVALSGIIQVKAAKQAVKTVTDRVTMEKTVTTNVAVTATVTDANGKKWSYSKGIGTVEGKVTGLVCTAKGVLVSAFDVSLGANGLSGEWGDLSIVGARNGMGTKGDAMMADLEAHYKKSWSVTFTNESDVTRLQLVIGAKGSTKISGTTADGFKVSATVQGVMGEEAFFVPYRATLKSGKLSRTVCLLLALKRDGSVEVLSSDIGALKSGGPTTDALEVQPYEESAFSKGGETYAGAVVLNDLAYPAKFAAKGLPAGLKINAATGAITGTPTKPGHYVATITVTSGINAKVKTTTVVEFDIANFTDDEIPVKDAYGDYCVGVMVSEPITNALGCTVSGLPAGLKFAAKETKDKTFGVVPAGTVYGVPTKAGEYTVYFKKSEKVKDAQGKTVTVNHQASATFVVNPLPVWAQGTFDGAVDLGVASPSGLVTFTVSAAGKMSGKLLRDGLTWTLAATAYESYDAGMDEYVATVVGKSGKLAFTNEVTMSAEPFGDSVRGNVTGDGLKAWQNLWKTEPWKSAAKPFANKTLLLSGVEDGLPTDEDSISLKFAATGAVTAKFGTYSCSSVLIPDEVDGCYRLFLYFPPKSGKFDGYAMEVPLVWDGEKFTLGD